MALLIGGITGLWIVLVIWTVIYNLKAIYASNLDKNLKLSISIYLVLGLLYVLEALISLSMKLVDML